MASSGSYHPDSTVLVRVTIPRRNLDFAVYPKKADGRSDGALCGPEKIEKTFENISRGVRVHARDGVLVVLETDTESTPRVLCEAQMREVIGQPGQLVPSNQSVEVKFETSMIEVAEDVDRYLNLWGGVLSIAVEVSSFQIRVMAGQPHDFFTVGRPISTSLEDILGCLNEFGRDAPLEGKNYPGMVFIRSKCGRGGNSYTGTTFVRDGIVNGMLLI